MSLDLLKYPQSTGSTKTLCLEVTPPRGVKLDAVFARLDGNLEGVDFLNVTDCALAKMRLAALPFAAILKQRYNLETLVNVSCRDRNLIALQADLLAAWAQGVRSVVALTGDAVTVGDSPDRKGVFEVNSVGLLNTLRTLNSGKDLVGNTLDGAPDFTCGVVVNPNARNRTAEIKRLQKKKAAGARYALSQPVFDTATAQLFLEEAQSVDIPIMLGLLPFKNVKFAHAMNNVPGITFPEKLMHEIEKHGSEDLSDIAIQHCLALAKETEHLVSGFHVISGATPSLAVRFTKELARALKKLS